MTDRAHVWKFAFGALVLLFCAVTWIGRREANPAAPAREGVPVSAVMTPAPATALPPASAPPPIARDPAPADLPEAQETPVRIRVALDEPPSAAPRAVASAHRPVRHTGARTRRPRPAHAQVHHRRRRLVANNEPDYPFVPSERWAKSSELP